MSTESTPRERLARILSIVRRARMYWVSTGIIALLGVAISFAVALHSKRIWRSETTVLYRDMIDTGREGETTSQRAARLGPKLKDLLNARPTLTPVIEEFNLYPEKQQRSMLEALEQMQKNLGFRARNSDTYVISFLHEDPAVAQKVAARLADIMINEFTRQNLDTATMTREFLQRERNEANENAERASRALATFLAEHPQFQWGANESPYAPTPTTIGVPGMVAPVAPQPVRPAVPSDPELASLEQKLSRVDAALAPAVPVAPRAASPELGDAQKQRDAAAAALTAAQTALAEKLQSLTPAHPDAQAASMKVEAAKRALADADAALKAARGPGSAAPETFNQNLSPQERDRLLAERNTLLKRMAERRVALRGTSPAPAPDGRPTAKTDASSDVVELETEWHRLRLDLDQARDHLRAIEAKARGAEMSAAAAEKQSQSEMMILDPAYLPSRPDKGRGRVFLAGSFLAIFFAFGYAGFRVLSNDRLYDEGDVAALGGPSVLVTLPRMPVVAPQTPRNLVPAVSAEPESTNVRRRDTVRMRDEVRPQHPSAEPFYHRPHPAADPYHDARAVHVTPPPRRRNIVQTVRWGTPHPDPGIAFAESPIGSSVALAPVRRDSPRPALALVQAYPVVEATVDEPEVEVIAADVDPNGLGAVSLLAQTPPKAMAALRVLRHRLDQKRGEGHMVVGVVSPGEGEGKTMLALRLAMTLAEAERARVVLVEGNFARPRVAHELGIRLPEDAGFSAQIRRHMQGRGRTWGVVRLSSTLSVLAEPGAEATYPDALHSHHFDAALRALQRTFDYVVIDGPAVLGSGDANVVENVSDAVLTVARSAVTQGAALADALDQLGDRRILGIVLNDVVMSTPAKKQGARPGRIAS